MPVLSVTNLACLRGGRMVFSGLSFSLEGGCVCVLSGDNGAGKTSLLRILAGLLPYSDGTLTWKAGFESRHFIGQRDGLKDELSAAENLAFYHPAPENGYDPLRVSALLREDVRILSHGQRRRVHLHRLFIAPRPVWLLDEPETGLDQTMIEHLRTAMHDHAREGGVVLAASHHPQIWEPHRVLHMGNAP